MKNRTILAELGGDTAGVPTITIVNQQPAPLLASDLDFERCGVSKKTSRAEALAAGGVVVGKRVLVAREKLLAHLEALAKQRPARPKVRKAPTSPTMTADEVARANGLRPAAGAGAGK